MHPWSSCLAGRRHPFDWRPENVDAHIYILICYVSETIICVIIKAFLCREAPPALGSSSTTPSVSWLPPQKMLLKVDGYALVPCVSRNLLNSPKPCLRTFGRSCGCPRWNTYWTSMGRPLPLMNCEPLKLMWTPQLNPLQCTNPHALMQ